MKKFILIFTIIISVSCSRPTTYTNSAEVTLAFSKDSDVNKILETIKSRFKLYSININRITRIESEIILEIGNYRNIDQVKYLVEKSGKLTLSYYDNMKGKRDFIISFENYEKSLFLKDSSGESSKNSIYLLLKNAWFDQFYEFTKNGVGQILDITNDSELILKAKLSEPISDGSLSLNFPETAMDEEKYLLVKVLLVTPSFDGSVWIKEVALK